MFILLIDWPNYIVSFSWFLCISSTIYSLLMTNTVESFLFSLVDCIYCPKRQNTISVDVLYDTYTQAHWYAYMYARKSVYTYWHHVLVYVALGLMIGVNCDLDSDFGFSCEKSMTHSLNLKRKNKLRCIWGKFSEKSWD